MRLKLLRLLAAIGCFIFISGNLSAQNCIPTNINGAVITMACGQTCTDLVFPIPHMKSTSDYTLVPRPYNPYPYLDPSGGESAGIYNDDQYGDKVTIPFPFCFYDSIFYKFTVGSNGLLTFDTANANCSNAYLIAPSIPNSGGGAICSQFATYYPRAAIMAAYSDLDPRTVASPPDVKVMWFIKGNAPCRKFIISFYHVGVFGVPASGCPAPSNTFQIILHESTGIIEYFFEQKSCTSSTNSGRAIQGIQNWNRDKAVFSTGRNPGVWSENNKGYAFIPSAGASRYLVSELYTMGGTLVATADTTTTTPGLLDVRFPNFCPPPGPSQYVVKTSFSACENIANLLISYDTITINRNNNLNATASTTNTTCGPPNGTITATVPPGIGTAPFIFVLDGVVTFVGASPHTFNNVSAGPHTVVITDASGCISVLDVAVGLTNGITANTSSTATACSALSTGTITITPTSGSAPWTYSLDGGPFLAGPSPYTFNNVSGGNHNVIVTDAGGCVTGTIVVFVATGPGVSGNATSTPTACPTATDGTITVTATAGVAPFTFQLDGGLPQAGPNPYTFFNVAAGAHTVIIWDNLRCALTINLNVDPGPGLSATATPTSTSCGGASDGTITVTPTSGSAPWTYSLDGAAPVGGPAPYTFTGVTSGPHTIVVSDASGCVSNIINVTVPAGSLLNATVTPAATSCSGASDGTITVTPTNGTAPYTFSLDGAAPVGGPTPYTFTGVAAGPHTIVANDASGCITNTINVTVLPGSQLNATVTPGATSCSGASDGTITVTPTNGTAPYTFSLDGAAPIGGAAPYTFTGVAAGNHTIVVISGAGCTTNTINVTVPVGPQLTTTANKTDVLCNGGATGTITVIQPTIGTAPYEYSLDGITWQGSPNFIGLVAGTYTVYFRESNGCQGTTSVTIAEPTMLTATAATTAVVCNGQSNGIINVSTGGGVTPYQYSIDGGATWQASNIFNVPAGNYTITIRDANNCTTSKNVAVTEPAALTASSANSNASCGGGNDGVITVNANGGNTGYQYSLDGINFQASNVFNVAPGNYTVRVKDNLGCTTNFNTTVGLNNNLSLTQQTDPTICEGTSTQLKLTSNATGYAWSPAIGLSDPTISNPIANPIATTQYIVTATLGPCSANDTVIVNVNAAPIPNAGSDGFICYGQTYMLQGSGGSQYTWTPSTYLSSTSGANPIVTPLRTITYTLSLVVDAIGCRSLVTDSVTVDVTPPIKVRTFPYDTIGYPGDQFQLMATSSANIYTWSPAIGLSDPTIANPVVTVGLIGDDVLYQVIASTAAGCKGEGYVRVRVYKGPDIYVPTGFTPNGDGKNDKFIPFPVGIKSIVYFRVFNRWGQMLFSTTTLNDGWDGKLSGRDQPSGVYVWMVQGITKDNRVITKKGTVTIIR